MSNKYLGITSGFPRLPLKNGIGRTICQLKRITIKFCKSSGSCNGVRQFIENDLLDFCRLNPEVVVYLKPRRHHSPVFISEYLNGERHYMNAHNFTRDSVNKWMSFFRTRIGHKPIRFRKLHHTELPSIQGPWNPFIASDPKLNIMTFPNNELSYPANLPRSAETHLRRLFARGKRRNIEMNAFNEKDIEVQS